MKTEKMLQKSTSGLGAWAFAIGTSVGWGSLVVTASTYLAQSGPAGSILGLVVGALVMLIICRNYAYMMKNFPEAGGAYAYAREVFGYDQGFLIAWFVLMTYFAMLWANATSLPLFGRIFLGGVFSFGRMYTIFGYDVYIGEALLTMAAIAVIGILCIRTGKWTNRIMIGLALLFSAGIVISFFAGIFGGGTSFMSPGFTPDASAIRQIAGIAVISPWAFIGFESISNRTEEFSFDHSKIHKVLIISVLSTAALYILVILLSVTAYPPQFSSWIEYIENLGSLSGLEALPAFYAANHYLGSFGSVLLMLSLLALVITSLIGNISALSRLIYALGKDRVLPQRFAELNDKGNPSKAVLLVMAISFIIPFVGRTAIGWIVDVTTIGAVLIYGFVSACTMVMAKRMEDRYEMWTGRIGLAVMIALGAYFLFPNLVTKGTLATETYFLFIIWSVLGFVLFRIILQKDVKKRFGRSVSVWIAFLALILVIALIWMRQSMLTSYDSTISAVQAHYEAAGGAASGISGDEAYILDRMGNLEDTNTHTIIMAVVMFGLALIIMMSNHYFLNKRSKESEMLANRDPMTGVMSKHAWLVREKEMDGLIYEKELQEFAIVVCDVNGLKKINDTLGHKAGDEYIKKACTMICDIFRHSPVFRVGGDEFTAVLSGRDFAVRSDLMQILHDRSVEHIDSNDAVVSGGIAVFDPENDHNVHDVFQRADEEMYAEKKRLKSLGAVTRDDESDAAEEAVTDPMSALAEEAQIIHIRRQILIVEDEYINQQLLGNMLEEDYDVLYASDGGEALKMIRDHRDELALILLDLNMPQMDGREVLRAMNTDDSLSRIPVVVLTADQEAELECLKLGAVDFIPKPYPIWEIVRARVDKCIELSENRGIIQSTERDGLTRLFNIDYFYRYVNMFDQHYPKAPMDAIVLDVNHFRMINERYGKSYGDTVLRRIGEQVRIASRELGGVGCHKGADTFLIYCPHRESYEDVLEQITAGIIGTRGGSARVRLRMGVCQNVDKSLDIERRFDRAKTASDAVRTNYTNPIGFYDDEMGKNALYNARLLEDFHTAVSEKQFLVYFQPKFDVRPEKPMLSSAEALVRWKHPDLGMISPGVFIPLLEDNGLIFDLDRYVWEEAAAKIRKWKDKFGFSVPVSVNVSRVDMLMPNLKNIFREILDKYQLSADDIVLELTESAYTGDSEQVISTARELRGMGMGFRIEMDDFGTGYSSLGMLTSLPIDALKLDMTFIRNAFGETRDVRMIELIIDIADYLHVPVVAEGVETEEQYLVLKALGCDLVQGYYFSKPVPEEEFEAFLIERKDQSVGMIPEIRKSCMSISTALSSDFDSIFYVDTVTDYYLEFYTGDKGELEIRPGGDNFFRDAEKKILADVADADIEKVRKALGKENLMNWMRKEENASLPYLRKSGRIELPYCLQSIRTRNSDDHHVVIGIRKSYS